MIHYQAAGLLVLSSIESEIVHLPFSLYEAPTDETVEQIARKLCLTNGLDFMYWQEYQG